MPEESSRLPQIIAGSDPHTYTVYLVRRGTFKVTFPPPDGESGRTLVSIPLAWLGGVKTWRAYNLPTHLQRLTIINRPADHPYRVPTAPPPPLLTDAELAAGSSTSSSPVPTSDPDEIPLVIPAAARIATRNSHRSPSGAKTRASEHSQPNSKPLDPVADSDVPASHAQSSRDGRAQSPQAAISPLDRNVGPEPQSAPASSSRRRNVEDDRARSASPADSDAEDGSSVGWDGILKGLQAYRDDRERRYAAIIISDILTSWFTFEGRYTLMTRSKKVVVHVNVPASPDDVTVEVNLDLEQLPAGVPYTVTTACISDACDAPTPPPTPSSSTMPLQATSVEYFLPHNLKGDATQLPPFPGHPGVSVSLEKAVQRSYGRRVFGLGPLLARCKAWATRLFLGLNSDASRRSGSTGRD
ncbi:hypothetical protein BV25DRAFT_1921627 [Artomyces pyxidatus]|uniref:Uncharacterized protein n=1 Tax=Artomyces pyxidatus TaxID=48021 RepID=A0ACB8SIP9_9AGAM|nr:hypothetical protein BV25DRAFT_1921627 [Artomyces pyxidatus]